MKWQFQFCLKQTSLYQLCWLAYFIEVAQGKTFAVWEEDRLEKWNELKYG